MPHIVAAGSLTQAWSHRSALFARLYGLRFADAVWLQSNGAKRFQHIAAQPRMKL